jgi:hypothetical protein
MSLLDNWFSKKTPGKAALESASSGVGQLEAHTRPARHAATPHNNAAQRRSVRLERRELLYGVIRESMIHAGVLSSTYKFKVLSLDAQGQQYLVMVDLAHGVMADMARLADVEAHIAHGAKARHDILVTAVYWRDNEHVSEVLMRKFPSAQTATSQPSAAAVPASLSPRHEADQEDERRAYKPDVAKEQTGELMAANPEDSVSPPGFADTEVAALGERISPLSGTQYGDLK